MVYSPLSCPGSPVRTYSVYSAYSLYSHTAIHAIHHTALYSLPQAAAVEQRLRKPEAAAMEHLEPQAAPSVRTTPTTEAECEGEESEASIVD